MKIITTNKEAREKQIRGINIVGDIVSSTLGPNGSNVMLDKGWGSPVTTNDGVSIAREIELEDEIENQSAQALIDVANRVNQESGDSTSTSITLSQAVFNIGLDCPESVVEIHNSLEKIKVHLIDELKRLSNPIKNQKDILHIATTSAESEELGKIISDTVEAVGKDGKINVEDSGVAGIEVEMVEGYEIDKGLAHFQMGGNTGKAICEDAHCLVMTGNLQLASEILPFLQKIEKKTEHKLVIFCENIDPGVINFFLANKVSGNFNGVVVRVQSQKNEILEDIAQVTGAKLIRRDTGITLDKLEYTDLGRARNIIITTEKTTIIDGKGKINELVKTLKENLKTEKNDNVYDLIENRIARLTGGMAIIRVGAKVEAEQRRLKDKVDDAVTAVKSALEEGYVEGGGLTLYRLSETLTGTTVGSRIMKKALKSPIKKIIENSNKDYDDIIKGVGKLGYDAKNNKYVDMIKEGIINSTKGERCSIEMAIEFAGNQLRCKTIIANKKQNEK